MERVFFSSWGDIFFTPVIVSPYKDFVQEFGEEIDFGLYNFINSPQYLADNITKIMNDTDYKKKCLAARDKVENYTWDNYVDKITQLMMK